jgi:hypothetical protein
MQLPTLKFNNVSSLACMPLLDRHLNARTLSSMYKPTSHNIAPSYMPPCSTQPTVPVTRHTVTSCTIGKTITPSGPSDGPQNMCTSSIGSLQTAAHASFFVFKTRSPYSPRFQKHRHNMALRRPHTQGLTSHDVNPSLVPPLYH